MGREKQLTSTTHSEALARFLQVLVGTINLYNNQYVSIRGAISDSKRASYLEMHLPAQHTCCSVDGFNGNKVDALDTIEKVGIDLPKKKHTVKLIREGIVVLGLRTVGTCEDSSVNSIPSCVGEAAPTYLYGPEWSHLDDPSCYCCYCCYYYSGLEQTTAGCRSKTWCLMSYIGDLGV